MIPLARKMLLHDRPRFLITVSGVAFAVTLILVQVGLFRGLLNNASVAISRLPADLWVTSRNVANIDFAAPFPENYVQRVRSVPGVERADNLIVWFAAINLPTGARETFGLYALENFPRWGFPWQVLEGNPADLRRGNYLFLDESARKRFGRFSIGDYREVLGRRLKLIGLSRGLLSFTTTPQACLDYRRAQALDPQNLTGKTTYVVVKLRPGADVSAVQTELQRRLPYNDVLTRDQWAERSRRYWTTSTGLGLNLLVTVFLGCLVGVVIVGQTLYTSTLEHAREFATVKAIGGRNADIYRIVSQQALISGLVGFALGVALTLLLRPVIGGFDLEVAVTPALASSVFGGTLFFCLCAALLSFQKIAGLDPATVFRG